MNLIKVRNRRSLTEIFNPRRQCFFSRFALCGSSARKLRRGHANLLGGRAIRFELYGLVLDELGSAFDQDTRER